MGGGSPKIRKLNETEFFKIQKMGKHIKQKETHLNTSTINKNTTNNNMTIVRNIAYSQINKINKKIKEEIEVDLNNQKNLDTNLIQGILHHIFLLHRSNLNMALLVLSKHSSEAFISVEAKSNIEENKMLAVASEDNLVFLSLEVNDE